MKAVSSQAMGTRMELEGKQQALECASDCLCQVISRSDCHKSRRDVTCKKEEELGDYYKMGSDSTR